MSTSEKNDHQSRIDSTRAVREPDATAGQNEAIRAEHSPLPWHIGRCQDEIVSPMDGTVSMCINRRHTGSYLPYAANAEFIVRAVNNHDALVAALKAFLEKWPAVEKALNGVITISSVHGVPYSGPNIGAEIEQMRIALAKVSQ